MQRHVADLEQTMELMFHLRHDLQGVIDFFQTRRVTKLNITMERVALLSALLLPITAIASIYGMNATERPLTSFNILAILGARKE